ncbi:acyltransferase family protein [uncultured Albimonas sp.]|uniref:acyltransferase family protein n=1 Tax=uncultured Albimonas sp. TaxID=1331701 RepID=UPI0030EBD666
MNVRYRADIDGLRAVAVLPVVLFHAQLGFPGGFVGVDVFFVISGYLITSILLQSAGSDRFSLLDFYERRARRIFPALFAMIFATLLVGAWLMIPSDFEALGRSALATLLFVSNVLFFLEVGYFDVSAHLKPLMHTWSLAVEEQYYLIFPLVLHLVAQRFGRRAVVAALVAAAVISFGLMLATAGTRSAFFLLPARGWELALGALLAACPGLSPRSRRQAEALSLAGAVAVLAAIFALDDQTTFPGLATLLPCLGAAALISAGRGHAPLVSRALATAPFVWVGRLSYSLYLWHWPIIVFGAYGALSDPSLLEKGIAVGLSVLLSALSLKYIETPIRRGRVFSSRRAIFGGASVAFTAIAIVGAFTYVSNGVPGRMPQNVAQLLDWQDAAVDPSLDCDYSDDVRLQAHDICVAGAVGATPSFALVGDSHADAWAPGVFVAAQELGLSGYQIVLGGFRPYGEDLEARTALVVDALRALSVETVFLIGFWSAEATGFIYHSEVVETPRVIAGNDERLFRNLEMFVNDLPGKRFVIFDDNPVGRPLDRFSLARHWFARSGDSREGLERSDVAIYRTVYQPVLERLAAAHDNVRYVPAFVDALCREGSCPRVDPEIGALYRDGNHVSVAAAVSLVPLFRSLLNEALSAPSH